LNWREFLKPEILSIALNLGTLIYYVGWTTDAGKMVYWLGASIVMIGVYMLRGT
jgi:hypothetical protein